MLTPRNSLLLEMTECKRLHLGSIHMVFHGLCVLLCCWLILPAVAQTSGPEPTNATEWFARAEEQMNLRLPGSSPFHMKVVFHAFPGIELVKNPKIVTGDGVYEETWISPQQWRQEVTLGSYHAVEVQSGRVRKMQATSDYEPSRVLMLLQALLAPVPQNLVTPEFNRVPLGWRIEPQSVGSLQFVRISRTWVARHTFTFAYVFLRSGLLVQDNEAGLITSWQKHVVFAGKVVPMHFAVQAMGRDLLTADVTIDAALSSDAARFDLPGAQAKPGESLRPFQRFEVRELEDLDPTFSFASNGNWPSPNVLRQVVDRHGAVQEVEVIAAQNVEVLVPLMDGFRHDRWHPGTVDESPCEGVWYWYY